MTMPDNRLHHVGRTARLWVGLLLAALLMPSIAAQESNKPDAYEIITDGLSPDGRFTIAKKHQDNDNANGHHREVYLLAEPGHRKIGMLEEVEANGNWPPRYQAHWSADSHHVAIVYALGGRFTKTVLYRIGHGRAYPAALPDLLKIADKSAKSSLSGYVFSDWKARNIRVEWVSQSRFRLLQSDGLNGTPRQRTTNMGRFFQIIEGYEASDNTVVIAFGAEAACELLPGDRCRVLSIKPDKHSE